MIERRFSGLFESLEASFVAAEGLDERRAAEDLALSLRQDRSIRDVLARGGWSLQRPEGIQPVRELGRDYVSAGPNFVPLSRSTFVATPGSPPLLSEATLLQRLREWTRSGLEVSVRAGQNEFSGRLLSVGRDHILVGGRKERLVPVASIERVSRLRGGSTDAP